jgi:hypothetical protein
MKNSMQKSVLNVSMASLFSVFIVVGAQAATFKSEMKLGIISSTASTKDVVLYNEDQSKCLTVHSKKTSNNKGIYYAACRMDGTDTWTITNTGKIKNKRSGKCLSTKKGQDDLELTHCTASYSRYYTEYEFVIFEHMLEDDGTQLADMRY